MSCRWTGVLVTYACTEFCKVYIHWIYPKFTQGAPRFRSIWFTQDISLGSVGLTKDDDDGNAHFTICALSSPVMAA